jgi:hypothetical protein
MSSCAELVRSVASDEYETASLLRKTRIRLQLIKCRLLCQPKNCLKYRNYLRKLASASRDAIAAAADFDLQAAEERAIERLSRKF